MKNFYSPLLVVGVGILFSVGTAFAATDDYTNRFTFDEGTGRSAGDLVGGQNGALTGTSTGFGWASGMIGTALGMDGGSGESVVLPNGFLSGTEGSISLWFKMNNLSDRNVIFSGQSTNDNYIYAALVVNHEGRPEFVYRAATDGSDKKAQGSGILNKNEWYLLVFTANGQGYRMFVNGEEASMSGDNTGKWFSDFTNRTLKYRIGSLDSNPRSGVFDGYLDDLRIYNRVLTQEDVTSLYNGGNPGTPDVPLAAKEVIVPTVVIDLTPTPTPVAVAPPSTPLAAQNVLTTPTTSSVTDTALSADTTRKAKIQELIGQILLLIAELQKQLAVLKAQAVSAS